MADVRAFRGWRYNLAQVGELSQVVAPPYDVISPAQQSDLYQRHPTNVIRLILNREKPSDGEGNNRYTRAARLLKDWKSDGILLEDPDAAVYVCHQEFEVEGIRYTRRGFFARLKLEPFGSGKVFPHEETMPGPKRDRLELFRHTGMNLSPIFGIYPDSENSAQEVLERASRNQTPLIATDDLGVTSKIWPVTNQETISQLRAFMGPNPIFIADGHHRYETALQFQSEAKAVGRADYVLMMCVSMSDPGLAILPTHRLVNGIGEITAKQLCERLEPEFDIEATGHGSSGCAAAWELVELENAIGFGTGDGQWQVAKLRDPESMRQRVPNHTDAWRNLAVSVLHELALPLIHDSDTPAEIQYVHLLSEVQTAAADSGCELCCLVPPATMQEVQSIASSGERMPAKSTYFYPKLLSGLVFNPIR